MALLWTIFAQVIPGGVADPWRIAVRVGVIVGANAALTQFVLRRWRLDWASLSRHLVSTSIMNLVIVNGYLALMRSGDGETNDAATIFFVFLLTLIVVLFDRFHLVRSARALDAAPIPTAVVPPPDGRVAGEQHR